MNTQSRYISIRTSFKQALESQDDPSIEDYLNGVAGELFDDLLHDLIVLDVKDHDEREEVVDSKTYESRFPGKEAIIHEAFERHLLVKFPIPQMLRCG